MFDFFKGAEFLDRETLKKNLNLEWPDYFFRPLSSVAEFKEINFSMLSMQWHYFYVGLVKGVESVRAILKATYNLLTHRPSESISHGRIFLESSLSSMANVVLSASLICLGILRNITLVINTFVYALAYFCEVFVDKLLDEDHKNKQLSYELDEFSKIYSEVLEEKSTIEKHIAKYSQTVDKLTESLPSPQGSFVEKNEQPVKTSVEQQKYKKLIGGLAELLQSYPKFDAKQLCEVDYLRRVQTEIEEHHNKTALIAGQLFENLDITYLAISNKIAEMKI